MRALIVGMVMAVLVAPLFGAPEVRAQDQEVRINLLHSDKYARRSMKVITKSGEELKKLLLIQAYDPTDKTFLLTTVTGESETIPAAEVKKIEFSQHLIRQPQYAQAALPETRVYPGPQRTVKIPAQDFKIQDGYLVTQEPAAQPPKTTPQGNIVNLTGPGSSQSVQEARSIVYDPQTDMFAVTLQAVQYVQEYRGGGGSGGGGVMEGGGKGLQ